MTHIFYFFTIFFIVYEITWIISPLSKAEDSLNLKKLIKQHKNKKWDEYSEEFKDKIKVKLPFMLMIIMWMMVGLFTFQWAVFLGMILFNLLVVSMLSKIFRRKYPYMIVHWFNSIIGFCFGVFILINKYHLKIDVSNIIIEYIKTI